jgi:hypothetical protein
LFQDTFVQIYVFILGGIRHLQGIPCSREGGVGDGDLGGEGGEEEEGEGCEYFYLERVGGL